MVQGSCESDSLSGDLWEPRDHRLLFDTGRWPDPGILEAAEAEVLIASETGEAVGEFVRRLGTKEEREKE